MEKRLCPNCGAELAMIDGKIMCPMCGTDFAIDYGKEDVDMAAQMTAEERKVARFERNARINQAKEEIARQEQANAFRRHSYSSANVFKRFVIIGVIIFAGYFFISMALRLVLMFGIGKVNDKNNVTPEIVEVNVENLAKDEFMLENAIESGYYYIKYENLDSTWSEKLNCMVYKTDNAKFLEAYLIKDNGSKKLCLFYEVEYVSDNGKSTMVYCPVQFMGVVGQENENFLIEYTPYCIALADDRIHSEYLDKQIDTLKVDYAGQKIKVPSSVIEKVEEERA